MTINYKYVKDNQHNNQMYGLISIIHNIFPFSHDYT